VTVSGTIVAAEGDSDKAWLRFCGHQRRCCTSISSSRGTTRSSRYAKDTPVVDFLRSIPGHRTVLFRCPPTAEHLSVTALRMLEKAFGAAYGNRIRVEQVRIYETAQCWADADHRRADELWRKV